MDTAIVTIDTTGITSGIKWGKIFATAGTQFDSIVTVITIPNLNAPKFVDPYPQIANLEYNRFDVGLSMNMDGEVYFIVVPDTANEPTTYDVIKGIGLNGFIPIFGDSIELTANEDSTISFTGLAEKTGYDIYFVLKDLEDPPNYSTRPVKLSVLTPRRRTHYYVNGAGDQDFITIQSALDSLISNDTISVYEGTYKERIDFLGKSIRLVSLSGKEKTIIDAETKGTAIVLKNGESTQTHISGFTITNGLANQLVNENFSGGGVFINNANPKLENLIIENNMADYSGGGLFIEDGDTVFISNVFIQENTAKIGAGIHTNSSITIENTLFKGNNNTQDGGTIFIEGHTSEKLLTIINSSILGSEINNTGFGSELHLLNSDNVVLFNSLIWNDQYPPIGIEESNLKMVHSLFFGNRSDSENIIISSESNFDSTAVVEADPLINIESGLPYSISKYSPIIGRGLSSYNFTKNSIFYTLNAPSKDLNGNSRPEPESSGVDLGVYESSLANQFPLALSIRDGLTNNDLDLILDENYKLSVNWDRFIDDGSVSYQYALGSSNLLLNNFINWTSIDTDTSITLSEYTIVKDVYYYFSVIGTDSHGQLSDTITTDGQIFTIDTDPPVLTSVVEYFTNNPFVDIDWMKSSQDSIGVKVQGTDDVMLDYFYFSLGNESIPNEYIPWTKNLDSIHYFVDPIINEGITYRVWAKAIDIAGNVSDSISSNGFQVDDTAPIPGGIIDGTTEDIDVWSNLNEISFNWDKFTDPLSGVNKYMVSVIDSISGEKILENFDVGLDTFYTATGLNFIHGKKYFTSVAAFDLLDNKSIELQSDGFLIDQFNGPAIITSISPVEGSSFSIYGNPSITIELSEPVQSATLDIYANVKGALTKSILIDNNIINVSILESVVSLDTITISVLNMVDLARVSSSDSVFTYYTHTIADYNGDLSVDAADLANFVTIWNDGDISQELGPATGNVPHLLLIPDNQLDLRDIMVFTRMWHWSRINPSGKIIASNGFSPTLLQEGNTLSINFELEATAGEIELTYDPARITIEPILDYITSNQLLLFNDTNEGSINLAFADLKGEFINSQDFTFSMNGKENTSILIRYSLIDESGIIVSSGYQNMDLTPIPEVFALHQNYPNPFNPVTTINYDLPQQTHVNLMIYDILGREVVKLVSEEIPAGYQSIIWNTRNNFGQPVSAGIYFYQIQAKDFVKTRKMVLIK